MADFNKVQNGIQTGLNVANSVLTTVAQIRAAKQAQKSGAATEATKASDIAVSPATGASAPATESGGTGVSIGINRQTLIVGGIVVVGIVAAIMLMRRNN